MSGDGTPLSHPPTHWQIFFYPPYRPFRFPIPLCRGVAKAALYCAHRTSTVSLCAFCEQEGHLAAPPPHPSEAARCASTEDHQAPSPPFHRGGSASKKGTWPLPPHSSEAARYASTEDQPGQPLSPYKTPLLPPTTSQHGGVSCLHPLTTTSSLSAPVRAVGGWRISGAVWKEDPAACTWVNTRS